MPPDVTLPVPLPVLTLASRQAYARIKAARAATKKRVEREQAAEAGA